MVSLQKACEIVLAERPEKRIVSVSEYEDEYAICLINKNEVMNGMGCIAFCDVVAKSDGKLRKDVFMCEDEFDRDSKIHSEKEIENLMKVAS